MYVIKMAGTMASPIYILSIEHTKQGRTPVLSMSSSPSYLQ